jgi:hypothetical protein
MTGTNISTIEVTNISVHGFWILVNDAEYFLPFKVFPWFKTATIDEIINVQIFNNEHLHWEKLDVDLELTSIKNPENYPLLYKK